MKDQAQERRQVTVKEKLTEIEVTVTREDFPLQKANIKIQYYVSSSQGAWGKFLSDVTKALKLDFIHSIVERGDKSPIFRIIMLKDQAEYLVRQRENSAVLEVLNNGISPMEISWEVTRDIVHTKKDLEFNVRTYPVTQQRVFHLVTKPITSLHQKEFVQRLLETTKPKDIIDDINKLYLPGLETWSPEYISGLVALNYSQTQRLDQDYDMVSVHRMSLEQLDRLCTQGFSAIIAKQAIHYVFKVMSDLANEPDIVAIALKLTADLVNYLIKQRDGVFTAVLNAMQHYAPVAPAHRPRKPKRLAMTMDSNHAHMPTAPAMNYDLTGMFVDPSAIEKSSSSQQQHSHGKNKKVGIEHAADAPNNATVEAILAKREAQMQETKMKLLNRPPSDLFQLSRYGEYYATDSERSHLRGITNKAIGFAQRVDFDEGTLRPITPKMRKMMAEEEKTKLRLEKEEEERKRMQEKLQREIEFSERNRPKVILNQRDRLDAQVAKAHLQHAKDNDATVTISFLPSISPGVTSGKHVRVNQANNGNNMANNPFSALQNQPSGNSNEEEDEEDDNNEDDEEEDEEEEDASVAKLPVLAPPLMKMTSSWLPKSKAQEADTVELQKKKALEAKKKKSVKITINKKKIGSEQVGATLAGGNTAAAGWSGTKGTVGKRFDPTAAPSPPKPISIETVPVTDVSAEEKVKESDEDGDGDDAKGKDNDNISRLSHPTELPAKADSDSVSVASSHVSHTLPIISRPSANSVHNNGNLNLVTAVVDGTGAGASEMEVTGRAGADVGVRTWVPSIATLIKRAKKVKFVKQPLPPAPRATFRGFDLQMPVNLVLTAALAAILQLLLVNYGNREWAFQHGVLAEIAEVMLDCSAMPRLLEYFLDIVEILYREGLGDATDTTQADDIDLAAAFDLQLDTASFLSAMVSHTGIALPPIDSGELGIEDGLVLDAMSEMSLPTVDADILWSQVHDQEAPRLASMSNIHASHTPVAIPNSSNNNKSLKKSGALLEEDDEADEDEEEDDDDDNDDDDVEIDGSNSEEKKKDRKSKKKKKKKNVVLEQQEMDAIVIQQVTDKDSLRSLAAIVSENGDYNPPNHKANNNGNNNTNQPTSARTGGRPSFVSSASNNTPSNQTPNANSHAPGPPSHMSSPGTTFIGSKHPRSARSSHTSKKSKALVGSHASSSAPVESGYRLYVKSTLRDRLGRNRDLLQTLGAFEFEARYRQTPEDSVIMALSMTMHHVEVNVRVRELAEFWLEFWADGSREYKLLILKGRNLCGL